MGFLKKIFGRKENLSNEDMLRKKLYTWLDASLEANIPSEVIAINFNLYEDADKNWTVEMIGSPEFDEEDEDWACNEIYTNRERAFSWNEVAEWNDIQSKVENILNGYIQNGAKADVLQRYTAVGVGFVDGDIEILYKQDDV